MAGDYPPALEDLAARLAQLPGIGKRTAERLALALLDWPQPHLVELAEHLAALRERVKTCTVCGNLAEEDTCRICRDPRRDDHVICVVEHARQIPVMEKAGRFRGVYHVLGGRVSPLDGIELEDLTMGKLIARIAEGEVSEIILATSGDVEGEATAACVAGELRDRFELDVTRIALGLPVGADLSFADAATLAMALDSRRPMRS